MSPIAQKLSFAPSFWMRSAGTPCASQSWSASSFSSKTVTHKRAAGMPSSTVKNCQAKAIASALK